MMHSSSSKVNSLSATHEITCLLLHLNVRNPVHRNQSPVPVLRLMSAVHIPPMCLHKDPFWNYSPTYMSVMRTVSMILKLNLVRNSHFSHACQMSRSCQPPRCHIPVIRDDYKYEVLHYMVFSKLLSIPPSYVQIFSRNPHLVVRLRMSWAILLLPLYTFKASTLPVSYPVLRHSTDSLDI
jgi:hypothetical protein